jgi:hypothetical protein
MGSWSLSLLLMALAGASPPERPSDDNPPERQAHQAVQRGVGFLEKEGLAWMKKQQCASCHHIPLMVWALNEARGRGFQVDEKALGEVTSWALAEANQDEVFPDLPLDKKRTETDYLGPLFMALGVGADQDRGPAVEKARRRLLAHAASQQAEDGSWDANRGGRPPVHGPRDVQTSWLLVALSSPTAAGADEAPGKSRREAAAGWLSRNRPADSLQGLALRLLVQKRLGRPAGESKPFLESLLRRQGEDGGWGQTQTMKSDAFATGLALYVLSEHEAEGVVVAVRRARAFLIRTQRPDGSWSMNSRPAEPPGPGPARDLRPIRYVGTAWATMGLVRSSPKAFPHRS